MGSHALSAIPQKQPAERTPIFEAESAIRFTLGDVEYAALPGIWYGRLPLIGERQFITAIPTDPTSPWTKATFAELLDDVQHEDDASEPEFRKALLFCGTAEGTIKLPRSLIRHLNYLGLQYHVVEVGNDASRLSDVCREFSALPIPGGAHLWSGASLRPVYRLYEDRQSCLMHYLQPSKEGPSQFSQLRIGGLDVQSFSVAVPSRIPCLVGDTLEEPLAGKRILVKDAFDICGIRMTLCDKAYYDISDTARHTAPAIQMLIDKGATVIGTAKLSSMISWEEPSECVDYPAPFNPRGDGMQSPAGSSSGSAAAIASYDWLDFAIGTDSTGSCRRPAMVYGCFGFRISIGRLPSDGMAPCFPLFDTPAVFSRDIRDLAVFIEHWKSKGTRHFHRPPCLIVYPEEYFDVIRNEQQRGILENFIVDAAAYLKINIRKVSLQQLWADDPPSEAEGLSLHTYLQDVGRNVFFFDYYRSTELFRKRYFDKHRASPPVNRMTSFRWKEGSLITQQQRADAGRRLEVYKTWLISRVLCGDNPIMLLPIMNAEPNYRDGQSCGHPNVQEAWDQLWLSPVLGAPEITVPIGQVPYVSEKTEVEEMLPVAISVMGLPGTDESLVDTVESVLLGSNRPLRVATGSQMFVEDWEMV